MPTKVVLEKQNYELKGRVASSCAKVTKYRAENARLRNILAQLVHHQDASELENVDEEDRPKLVPQDSPGHRHRVPGKWDADGSVCKQCESWAAARKILNEG